MQVMFFEICYSRPPLLYCTCKVIVAIGLELFHSKAFILSQTVRYHVVLHYSIMQGSGTFLDKGAYFSTLNATSLLN